MFDRAFWKGAVDSASGGIRCHAVLLAVESKYSKTDVDAIFAGHNDDACFPPELAKLESRLDACR